MLGASCPSGRAFASKNGWSPRATALTVEGAGDTEKGAARGAEPKAMRDEHDRVLLGVLGAT